MLTVAKIKALAPKDALYRVSDEKGLCIEIHPTGGKYWRFRYRHAGKQKMLSLGVYPETSLAAARGRRDDARRLVFQGIDPSAKRQQDKLTTQMASISAFEPVAREWLAGRGELAPATLEKLTWMLESHVYPWIGKRPIAELIAPEMLAMLRRIESKGKIETAQRVKQVCGQVFRYAVATGRAVRDPTADLKGALKTKKTRHHASITDPARVGELMRAIDGYSGSHVVACALKLASLVFMRPGELRQAEWSEFDLEGAVWRIPGEKMKMRETHMVPLSTQALEILHDLQPLTGRGYYVFPGIRDAKRPISENTINAALRRLGYSGDEMTGHGFRSMASTLLHEQGWPSHLIERQLAHAERNKVKASYNYAEYLSERKELMQAWSDYLDGLREGGKVVPIKKKVG